MYLGIAILVLSVTNIGMALVDEGLNGTNPDLPPLFPMDQGASKIWANALAIAVMGTAQQFFLVCKCGDFITNNLLIMQTDCKCGPETGNLDTNSNGKVSR